MNKACAVELPNLALARELIKFDGDSRHQQERLPCGGTSSRSTDQPLRRCSAIPTEWYRRSGRTHLQRTSRQKFNSLIYKNFTWLRDAFIGAEGHYKL